MEEHQNAVFSILTEEQSKVSSAIKAVLDQKAFDPVLIDVTGIETFTDYILICHGSSDTHVQAICWAIESELKPKQITPIGIEGETTSHWVLMDYGGLIVHIFYEPLREFYDLEGLWATCPELREAGLEQLLVDLT